MINPRALIYRTAKALGDGVLVGVAILATMAASEVITNGFQVSHIQAEQHHESTAHHR